VAAGAGGGRIAPGHAAAFHRTGLVSHNHLIDGPRTDGRQAPPIRGESEATVRGSLNLSGASASASTVRRRGRAPRPRSAIR
jgi:hypothetical protein